MKNWLLKTAWPMVAPTPYSAFHILFAASGILCAGSLAWKLRRVTSGMFYRVLFLCGALLAFSEVYKQLFLYYIVGQGHYDWWYFPFQLCSLPMYLCLLLPLFREHAFGRILCTFLQDFGLLGGIMALAEPSGLFHPYWTLTLHGLLWHVMLIFISLFVAFADNGPFITRDSGSGRPPETSREQSLLCYLQMLPTFTFFCLIATLINTLTHGAADMFYISPYYPVTQVVFDQISIHFGTGIGIMVYLLSVCLGGFLCHMGLRFFRHRITS